MRLFVFFFFLVTYLEIPGVSALARALSINSSLRILNMNLVNTRRFELSRLLDGVNSNRFLKRLYFKTTELFARGENKPRKAVDDMKQLVNFLETNKTLDAFDISGNAINPEMADELVNVMKYRNYSLKRFDMNSSKEKKNAPSKHPFTLVVFLCLL